MAMIQNNARVVGVADLPRKSFPVYLGYFVLVFIVDWMPIGARGMFNYAMLAVPVGALLCAAAGAVLSLRRLWQRRETVLDVVVIAGALSLALTFVLHVRHGYADHLATGWLEEAYPRYYLPLIAIVPLAGLSLLGAIESPRWRNALLGFLIAGPIAFHLLGAPLR
jgi:hypothetical protein